MQCNWLSLPKILVSGTKIIIYLNYCDKCSTQILRITVYPKKYAHGFCFAVLCCGYTLTDFPISIRLTSLALWQSNDCPSASKATLMNMDKYFLWIHYEQLHNHNKAKHNKTVCIFLGIYCISMASACESEMYHHHCGGSEDRKVNKKPGHIWWSKERPDFDAGGAPCYLALID